VTGRRSDVIRWIWLITLAGVAVGGSLTVYLVGSRNRANDKEAVLRYETQVLAQVREMNGVAGSLAQALAAYRARRVDAATLQRTVRVYAATLHAVAQKLAPIEPPTAVGVNAQSFGQPARLYASSADAVLVGAECARKNNTACAESAFTKADADAKTALERYRVAVRALQEARARLGFARSPNFAEPSG
jgi:hypothetical protein